MPELVILSLNRAEFDATHKQALAGDEQALQAIASVWDDYADRDLECFICGGIVERPVFTMALPERKDHTKAIAVALCLRCRALPPMQRLGRALRLLKKMWSRNGKQMHFTFKPRRR
jgi:hypothetical protein